MRRIFHYLAISLLLAPGLAHSSETGTLLLFRWTPGYKAEALPSYETSMSREEFAQLKKTKKLPDSPELYRACYLAKFKAGKSDRFPASAEPLRICKTAK